MKSIDRQVVERWYYEDKITTPTDRFVAPMYQEEGSRLVDPIYNDKDSALEIHTFGCSWTYGWGVKQTETFPHLLGTDGVSIHNHGRGGIGLDHAIAVLLRVLPSHLDNFSNTLYIITIPHFDRRDWFRDNGEPYRPWHRKQDIVFNDYNNYYYLLHQYEMLNTFIGDKIIWGGWSLQVNDQEGMTDSIGDLELINFEQIDFGDDEQHPGPSSHIKYAEKLKKAINEKESLYK